MDTKTFVEEAWLKAQGEPFSEGVGSEEWDTVVGLGKMYIKRWARAYDWVSLYDPLHPIGPVRLTDSYEFDAEEIRKFSTQKFDFVRVRHSDGNYSKYTLVNANQLQGYVNQNACAKVGQETLKFSRPFTADDPQVGGIIQVPAYLYPDNIEKEDDLIPVDDPEWLVSIVAWHLALLDVLRKDIAGIYLTEANQQMSMMKAENDEAQESKMSSIDMSGIGGPE